MSKVKKDIIANKEIWFISHTDSIKHHGHVYNNQQITTTQKVYEEFYNEKDYLARCKELKIEVEDGDNI